MYIVDIPPTLDTRIGDASGSDRIAIRTIPDESRVIVANAEKLLSL